MFVSKSQGYDYESSAAVIKLLILESHAGAANKPPTAGSQAATEGKQTRGVSKGSLDASTTLLRERSRDAWKLLRTVHVPSKEADVSMSQLSDASEEPDDFDFANAPQKGKLFTHSRSPTTPCTHTQLFLTRGLSFILPHCPFLGVRCAEDTREQIAAAACAEEGSVPELSCTRLDAHLLKVSLECDLFALARTKYEDTHAHTHTYTHAHHTTHTHHTTGSRSDVP